MAVITITSDFGTKDTTLAELKARFYSKIPDFHWVDITHEVEPYNVWQGGFLLRRVYQDFPKGSIHLLMVGSAPKTGMDYICIKSEGHYFLAADNGGLSKVLGDRPISAAQRLNIPQVDAHDPLGLFATAAAHIVKGGKVALLGEKLDKMVRIKELAPATSDNSISGIIIYIDHYGTCVTNITRPLYQQMKQGRKSSIETKRRQVIKQFVELKGDVSESSLSAYWDRHDHLCLIVGKSGGSAMPGSNQLLGLQVHDWVRIDFTE